LVFIAFPSLKILYVIDDLSSRCLTFRAVGYQWYWVYEYSNLFDSDFGSYANLFGDFRLIDCDDRLLLPFGVPLRIIVTSGDVIHSWTIPSFGVRADAVPGRLNQVFLNSLRLGVFVGQCSEICGSGHSFMPIVSEVIPVSVFSFWLFSVVVCCRWPIQGDGFLSRRIFCFASSIFF
jgi:cytochrome c oxidase subunit 2